MSWDALGDTTCRTNLLDLSGSNGRRNVAGSTTGRGRAVAALAETQFRPPAVAKFSGSRDGCYSVAGPHTSPTWSNPARHIEVLLVGRCRALRLVARRPGLSGAARRTSSSCCHSRLDRMRRTPGARSPRSTRRDKCISNELPRIVSVTLIERVPFICVVRFLTAVLGWHCRPSPQPGLSGREVAF
jgi:hypothetical protein